MLFLIFNFYVLRLAFVFGESMEPTLSPYDCVVVWQLAYRPARGDIVVTGADNTCSQRLIKRVIATEGQQVSLCGNTIYVDGAELEEPYLSSEAGLKYEPLDLTVPAGEAFLLGDNRSHSKDSREFGCFSQKSIKGKVVMRFFPFEIL